MNKKVTYNQTCVWDKNGTGALLVLIDQYIEDHLNEYLLLTIPLRQSAQQNIFDLSMGYTQLRRIHKSAKRCHKN